jgi:DNA-binding XRE family transcriptional regulator
MAKKRAPGVAADPGNRHQLIEADIMPLASLKDLRKGAKQTQKDLAAALGVGQDTISRLEKRSDMLLSTLRHYVECVGGHLTLVASFPHQPPVVIDHLGDRKGHVRKHRRGRKASVQNDLGDNRK